MSISHKEQGSVPHNPVVAVVVETEDGRLVKEAECLVSKLGDPVGEPDHIVHFGRGGVDIRRATHPNKKGHQVDFSTIDRRTGAGNLSKKQIFPKSIGQSTTTIVDATAGFGVDAAMLAFMGYHVTAFERSPILSVLLRDGLQRAMDNQELREAIGGRLSFVESDSIDALQTTPTPDVVYLDPMFPKKRKKSALPPKNAQVLQSIIGYPNEEQTQQLFDLALAVATKRVVVKRPNHAPQFHDNPVFVHKGKLVRYEVYKPL
jgi:16S rRNA (guanine1516-N2)-methyltransferase